MSVRHLLTGALVLTGAMLPGPARGALPAAVVAIDVADCFAVDSVTFPDYVSGNGGPVPCTSTLAQLPVRCEIHGDDAAGPQIRFGSVTRTCAPTWAYLQIDGPCLTGTLAGELWVYGPGQERFVTDLHANVVAGHGALATLGIFWTDADGNQLSGVAAGTVTVTTMSGSPCAVGDRVHIAVTLTGPYVA